MSEGAFGWIDWDTVAWAEWAAAAAGFLVVVFALFGRQVIARFIGPRFRVIATNEPPNAVRVMLQRPQPLQGGGGIVAMVDIAMSLYLRLRIENNSTLGARNLQAYASRVRRREGDSWATVQTFPPQHLRWSDMPGDHPGAFYSPRSRLTCPSTSIWPASFIRRAG